MLPTNDWNGQQIHTYTDAEGRDVTRCQVDAHAGTQPDGGQLSSLVSESQGACEAVPHLCAYLMTTLCCFAAGENETDVLNVLNVLSEAYLQLLSSDWGPLFSCCLRLM